jgi:hypothetical protein
MYRKRAAVLKINKRMKSTKVLLGPIPATPRNVETAMKYPMAANTKAATRKLLEIMHILDYVPRR